VTVVNLFAYLTVRKCYIKVIYRLEKAVVMQRYPCDHVMLLNIWFVEAIGRSMLVKMCDSNNA